MQKTKHWLMTIAMLLCSLTASAQVVDGINYNVISSTDLTVSVAQMPPRGGNEYQGVITIPSTINYNGKIYKVTAIGRYAFSDCMLVSVTIPASVTSIEDDAFSFCRLGSITCEAAIPPTISSSSTFYDVNKSIPIYVPQSSVSDYQAAEYWNEFTNIQASPIIASGSCGDNLTWKLTDEGELYIEGKGEIQDRSWDDYKNDIKSIFISEGVTGIEMFAFYDCGSLNTISLPSTLGTVGAFAFYDTNFKEVHINSLESWCNINFERDIDEWAANPVYGADLYLNGELVTDLNIPNSVTSIKDEAFSGCKSITSVTLPEGLTSIGWGAFAGCKSLTSINIPRNVGLIGESAFSRCNSLISIIIPEGMTSLEDYVFSGCSNLTSITIPEGVTSVGTHAFSGCSSLTSVIIPESVTSIGYYAFNNCSNLTSITIPEGVTSIGERTFSDCSSLSEINIPEGVTSIGNYAFSGCSNLTSVIIPESVTSIGYYAFNNCSNLTSITCEAMIPSTISNSSTFHNVDKSIPVYVPASSVEVYRSANGWREFSNIQPIILASGTCGDNLTWKLTDEGELYIEGTGRMTNYNLGSEVPWDTYRENISKVFIEEGVTCIGNYAFGYCINLASITIPNSVTSIEYCALANCSKLSSITLPEGIKSIGDGAFFDCGSLASVFLPEGVETIGNSAFAGCVNLTSITIPESVTEIDYHVFSDCSNLSSVTLSKGLNLICDYAFDGCSSLTTINIPEDSQLTNIGPGAFRDCSSLTSITLPEGVKDIWHGAFSGCSQLFNVCCYAKSVPSAYDEAFAGIREDAILYVPASVIEDYRNTAPWSDFSMIETIEVEVTNIALSHSSAQLKEGESMVLNAVVTPDNATDKTVSWTSSNPAVATVDADGTVTAMLEGTAIITATANDGSGVSVSCEVTVKEKPYDVIFMVDGEVYHTCSSEDVTFPEAPEKLNHTFVEWLEGDDVVLEEVDLKNNADAMLYTNAKCTNTQWGDQFTSWDVLFDKNANTFFHSEYSNVDSEDGLDHYIRVDMGKGKSVSEFTFTYTVRGEIPYMGNYSPKQMVVEGSNTENGEYTEIASLTELPSGAGAVYESPILGNGNKYRYIRFRVTETYQNKKVHGHPYFFMAEFGLKSSKKTRVYHAVYNLHSISININQYGSATYCSEYALDFSEVKGLKAYAATGYKTSTGIVTLTRVMTSQPGMGLFLKGEPGDEYAVPILESTDENSLNMLVGTFEYVTVGKLSSDGRYANYKYTIGDNGELKFWNYDGGFDLGAGKAYLQIPVEWLPAMEARSIGIRFDNGDGTTDIEDVELNIQNSELIYDLMGRRVTSPQKGELYIIDGKKVIY